MVTRNKGGIHEMIGKRGIRMKEVNSIRIDQTIKKLL